MSTATTNLSGRRSQWTLTFGTSGTSIVAKGPTGASAMSGFGFIQFEDGLYRVDWATKTVTPVHGVSAPTMSAQDQADLALGRAVRALVR